MHDAQLAAEGFLQAGGSGVPDVDGAVPGATDDRFSVGTTGNRIDDPRMATERAHQLVGLGVPDLECLILAAADDETSNWIIGDRGDGCRMAVDRGDRSESIGVPDPNGMVPAAADDMFAVGTVDRRYGHPGSPWDDGSQRPRLGPSCPNYRWLSACHPGCRIPKSPSSRCPLSVASNCPSLSAGTMRKRYRP